MCEDSHIRDEEYDMEEEEEYGPCSFCDINSYLYKGIMGVDDPFSPTCVRCIFLQAWIAERQEERSKHEV